MGLLSLYAAYKYGKRRAEAEAESEYLNQVCYTCGYPRHAHADDAIQSCPVQF